MARLIRLIGGVVVSLALAVPFLVVAALAGVASMTAAAAPVSLGPGVPEQYQAHVLAGGARCPRVSPSLLAALLAVESDWEPKAVSAAGAEGLAQFLPATWSSWGGDLDEDGVNSPLDPGDSIRAQADYLCHLLDLVLSHGLGDGDPVTVTSLALAADHASPAAVLSAHDMPADRETRHFVARVRALATNPDYALTLQDEADAVDPATEDVDAMLPAGYRNGRTASQAIAWALGQVGVWRDAGYCLRFVGKHAYQRPWDGASIDRAHQVWDHAPVSLRHPRDYASPRGAIVLWSSAIGGGAGHIAISLGGGQMVTTTRGAVAITNIRGFADHAYLGWMPPYFRST